MLFHQQYSIPWSALPTRTLQRARSTSHNKLHATSARRIHEHGQHSYAVLVFNSNCQSRNQGFRQVLDRQNYTHHKSYPTKHLAKINPLI
jgi:hypothetical protein